MKFCLEPWCTTIVPSGRCAKHQRPRRQAKELWPGHSWYRTPEWQTLRARKLREVPRCPGYGPRTPCGARTVDVDHRTPHKGDRARFFNYDNLDAYCHRCHACKTGFGQ